MEKYTNPALYVGTYKKYNNGSLFGEWVKINDFTDASEFMDYITQLHKDEDDPEFMAQDYEDLPKCLYSESLGIDEVEAIYEFMELDERERAIVGEYWDEVDEVTTPNEILEKFCYEGEFSDYARDCADEQINCQGLNNTILASYFNYEDYAEDLKQDYYITTNYVFYAC